MRSVGFIRRALPVALAIALALAFLACSGPSTQVSDDEPDEPAVAGRAVQSDGSREVEEGTEAAQEAGADEEGEPGEENDEEPPNWEEVDAEVERTGNIRGTVYYDDRPLAFGTVQLVSCNHKVLDDVQCGVSGDFAFGGVEPGRYMLRYINSRGVLFGDTFSVDVRPGRTEVVELRYLSNR